MVCMEVYTKNTQIKYLSTLCSKASIFVIICRILSVILPLIIAYNSKGFWVKTDTIYTQPNIKHSYEYLFYTENVATEKPLICSNIFKIENMFDGCSAVKIHEVDFNEDGKYDELHFNLSIYENRVNIKEFILILGFNIQVEDVCHLEFKTYNILQQSNFNRNNGHFHLIGDLNIIQNKLLCDETILNKLNKEEFDLWLFMKENTKNNLSTKIANIHTLWSNSMTDTSFSIILRYPLQLLYYKPTFWQVIKNAWIQYLSIFLIITWIINRIQDYIFTNKLVLYHTYNNKL